MSFDLFVASAAHAFGGVRPSGRSGSGRDASSGFIARQTTATRRSPSRVRPADDDGSAGFGRARLLGPGAAGARAFSSDQAPLADSEPRRVRGVLENEAARSAAGSAVMYVVQSDPRCHRPTSRLRNLSPVGRWGLLRRAHRAASCSPDRPFVLGVTGIASSAHPESSDPADLLAAGDGHRIDLFHDALDPLTLRLGVMDGEVRSDC